jgi:DNA-binding transcriptional ArsR family regulator
MQASASNNPAPGGQAVSPARAASLFRALAHPVRLTIVMELAGGERCVHQLVDRLGGPGSGIAQPLVSQHLRVLRAGRVVQASRRGKENVYRLVDGAVAEIIAHVLEPTGGHP